jgi:hypothetical protein
LIGEFRGDLAALLGAEAACLRATLAVLRGMLPAFSRALLAELCTGAAEFASALSAARHDEHAGDARFRAIATEADALHHHLHVVLAQTCLAAGFTGDQALDARFEAGVILLGGSREVVA